MTESEKYQERYTRREKEADSRGRVIAVRRLKLSEIGKVNGWTPELTGFDEITNERGETIKIPHRWSYAIAAAVCEIDNVQVPFARSRGELDAIYDRLDIEGLAAAGKALVRLNEGEAPPLPPQEEAKNSLGTPSSA
jgi:hypothetical protein